MDVIAATVYLLLVLGEAVADKQMFAFQTEKYRRKNANEPLGEYSRGFIETGLWGFSRHPNYFCEVTLWWVFYLFAVSCSGTWMHWSGLGPILLTSLFGTSPDIACYRNIYITLVTFYYYFILIICPTR